MTPWVQRLLIANVIVFFLQQTAAGMNQQFAFVPALLFTRPWTIVTYMFLHGGLGHIFFNLLGLYFFGPRVESRLGSPRFATLYLVSGIAGALLSMAFAWSSPIIGASAAIFGVMLAFARFWPREQVLIWGILPVEVRWLVLGYTVLSVYNGYQGSRGGVADFAHLGGFAGGFLYLLYLERAQGSRKFKQQATATPAADAMIGNWRNVNRESVHSVNKDEVDRILDKISAAGIDSLSPQERLFLSNFVPRE